MILKIRIKKYYFMLIIKKYFKNEYNIFIINNFIFYIINELLNLFENMK